MVDLTFTSWNRLLSWLRQLEALRNLARVVWVRCNDVPRLGVEVPFWPPIRALNAF